MNCKLSRIELDSRANDYVASQIDELTAFSRALKRSVDIANGQAWTLLPEGVAQERAYQFVEPEFLPVNAQRRIGRSGSMIAVASLRNEYAEHVNATLRKLGPHACLLLEHPMLKPGESQALIKNMIVELEDSVCLYLDQSFGLEDMYLAVDVCSMPWRGISVVCDPNYAINPASLGNNLGLGKCFRFAKKVSSIAYDGEGFIVIEKVALNVE